MELPDFSFEKKLWVDGVGLVYGADEVGRGCFAGPVVAACVSFSPDIKIPESILINDSKKLSAKKREEANGWIVDNSLVWGVGAASVSEINKNGIKKATDVAFRKSVLAASNKINNKNAQNMTSHLLVDAFYIPNIKGFGKTKQKAIKNGDGRSLSIAAASIVAKVFRDNLMLRLAKNNNHSMYGWENNKGYGTAGHREAIVKHGITKYHREQFVRTYLSKHSG